MKSDKPTFYCDIDSTVNDHYNRILRNTINGRCNFDKANTREEILKDKVLPLAKESLNILSEKYKIVFLTARAYTNARNITEEWLRVNNFKYDDLIVVNRSIDKIKYLTEKNIVFLDDLSKKHETHPPYTILYQDTIKELDRLNINYILFKGDWKEVMKRLGYE